MIPLV